MATIHLHRYATNVRHAPPKAYLEASGDGALRQGKRDQSVALLLAQRRGVNLHLFDAPQ